MSESRIANLNARKLTVTLLKSRPLARFISSGAAAAVSLYPAAGDLAHHARISQGLARY
jgi:hypothetical protein